MDLEITCIQMSASEKGGTLLRKSVPPITEVCIITITFSITGTKRGKVIYLFGLDWDKEKKISRVMQFELNEVFLANKTF